MSESDFRKKKIIIFFNNHILVITTIILSSLLLRLYFFPFGVPLVLDSFGYFWYASDISLLGKLPEGYIFANNGWSVFMGSFFSLLKLNGMISYMELQRSISVLISVLTVIPVYFLCKHFVNYKFAIIGAAIFAFEPRLIQDSLSGLNSSLNVALETLALVLFFSSNKYAKYYSFAIMGFASLVRSEGLFLFFALSIMYFLNYRKDKRELIKYTILFLIFIIIVISMAILRIQTNGSDGLTSRIIGTTSSIIENNSTGNQGIFDYIANGFITFVKFLGWDMIPIFIFFVPIGVFLIFRNRNYEKTTIIVTLVITSIPILYAYSSQSLDTKYFYPLYPIFCIMSALTMKKFSEFTHRPNFLIIIVIIGTFMLSFIFLNIIMKDLEYETEYLAVAQYVINNTNGINGYDPEDGLVRGIEINEKWPILKSSFSNKITIINDEGFNSLSDFIIYGKQTGLTHLVVDENKNRILFLKNVYLNEDDYPYLKKVLDTEDLGYKHGVKIFKIDYSLINQ